MSDKKKSSDNPRIVVIQKLYSYFLNKESELIIPFFVDPRLIALKRIHLFWKSKL